MGKREEPLEVVVARQVVNCYLTATMNNAVFERIRQGLDWKRFNRAFHQVVFRYDVTRKNRRRIRTATKKRVARALTLLATNPSQSWLS